MKYFRNRNKNQLSVFPLWFREFLKIVHQSGFRNLSQVIRNANSNRFVAIQIALLSPKDSRRLDPSFQSRPANSLINIYPDRCSIRPAFIYTQVLFHPFDNVTIVRLIEWEESLCRFFVTMEYISWRDALDGSIASSGASFSFLLFFIFLFPFTNPVFYENADFLTRFLLLDPLPSNIFNASFPKLWEVELNCRIEFFSKLQVIAFWVCILSDENLRFRVNVENKLLGRKVVEEEEEEERDFLVIFKGWKRNRYFKKRKYRYLSVRYNIRFRLYNLAYIIIPF